MNYLECPMYLWLSRHHPDLLPEDTPEKERIFAMGRQVDELSKTLFPGGVEIGGFGAEGWQNTQKVINEKRAVIFQPTVIAGDIMARADIVIYNSETGTFDINEVKMATKVQKEYFYDLGFQKLCFQKAGINIGRLKIIHINNQYVRHGDIDPKQLFKTEDITEAVEALLPIIEDEIGRALKVAAKMGFPDMGLLNSCKNPKYCEYLEYYAGGVKDLHEWVEEISPNHAFWLLEKEVIKAVNVPETILESIGYEAVIPFTNINTPGIKKELEKLQYPLYFFDYETYAHAIPPFDGTSPYQQIPFQYSLTIKDSPTSIMRHAEFLAPVFENPVPDLLEHLQNNLGSKGSVIVWFAQFESARNKEMAEAYPEYAEFLQSVNGRIYDLMLIFKFKNSLYIKSEFKQLASLKVVLPVLAPELSYKNLAIQEGGTASASWPISTDQKLSNTDRQKLREDMLAYCRRDTDAMLAILQKVCQDIGRNPF